MTRQRAALYLLLLTVAGAAAVLSFAALRDLALLCGFAPELAWLLPVVVDAGAAAGSLVWLGGGVALGAGRFARALALTLLALSVAANALGHGLAAYALAPAWWVVVIVSAIAPAVLGAVVHLAVLVGRPLPARAEPLAESPPSHLQVEPENAGEAPLRELSSGFHVGPDVEGADRAVPGGEGDRLPDRRAAVRVERDGDVIADLRALGVEHGRRYSRDEVKEMYGMGSDRATRLLNIMGWFPRAADRSEGAAS